VNIVKKLVIGWVKKHLWTLPEDMLNRAVSYSIIQRKFSELLISPLYARREDIWRVVLNEVEAKKNRILFLEFGVFEGASFRFFSKEIIHPASRLIGFDTFIGLPEDWGHRLKGTYSAAGITPDIDDRRASFIVGLFQDTFPSLQISDANFDSVVVHLDADLYSSTLFVLTECWRRFSKVYVIFDEFVGDEARALYNFSQAFQCDVKFLAHDSMPPKRVACIISGMRGPRKLEGS
jgi:O-methyltransferase